MLGGVAVAPVTIGFSFASAGRKAASALAAAPGARTRCLTLLPANADFPSNCFRRSISVFCEAIVAASALIVVLSAAILTMRVGSGVATFLVMGCHFSTVRR